MTAQTTRFTPSAAKPFALHPDRLFPADPVTRDIARRLYATVADLPIVSPHGHTDPAWFAENLPFPDPARLFIVPDHYVHRMLYSQGIAPEAVGVPRLDGGPVEQDPRDDLAPVRRKLPSVPGHAVLAVAEPRLHHRLRHRGAAVGGERRPALRPLSLTRLARPEFRPRALYRALQHRGAGDDR